MVIQFPTQRVRAKAVADGVRIAAQRMGYEQRLADRAAAIARRDFLEGRCSSAVAISNMVADLRFGARRATQYVNDPQGAA